ncbi:hypothetical protein EBT25_12540 [bacterium]|nr:hypothetical protein [bacterium]
MRVVILAGGVGTRLWPMSRSTKPKQFFDVLSDQPLLRDTFDRVARVYPLEDIFVSVSPTFAEHVRGVLPELSEKQIIIEPERRDTGPAMGFVAAVLSLDKPDEPTMFLPSDHYIRDTERFLTLLQVADELIKEEGVLVDIGVPPTFPSTALGYTKVGSVVAERRAVSVLAFAGHTEKPPYEIAKKYVEDGSHLWHANYYAWTPAKFLEAFEKYAPDMFETLIALRDAYGEGDRERVAALFSTLPSKAFDYLVTEKMDHDRVRILRGDFGWSDIGTWDTLHDRLSDQGNNVVKGTVIAKNTHGSLVYAAGDRLVAAFGLQDVMIVDTPDALLVCHKRSAEHLKELLAEIKEQTGEKYL